MRLRGAIPCNLMRLLQDTSKPAKGKRGREPTIVIVFFHRTTIDGESSQKLNKMGKTFSSRCGVYLAISRKGKSIKQKTKAGESEEKGKTFSAMWKKTKVVSKSSPLLNTLLLVLWCLAAVPCSQDPQKNFLPLFLNLPLLHWGWGLPNRHGIWIVPLFYR
jgi:hypothetical protein